MAFKAFEDEEKNGYSFSNTQYVTLSEDSVSSNSVHFLTGIRTLGKIDTLSDNESEYNTFNLNQKEEIKYKFDFTSIPLLGQALSADLITGVYSSTADQYYEGVTGTNIIRQQNVFDHVFGYLYRPDNNYDPSTTALRSSSTSVDVSVLRLINLKRSILFDGIKQSTFAMEFNRGIPPSVTGYTLGPSAETTYINSNVTGFTAAIDMKNPFGGEAGNSTKSFFAVPMNMTPYKGEENIDNIVDGITIEAVIRPHKSDSVIFFRRLANATDTLTKDKFIKLELTKSPNGLQEAFRFLIRNTATYPSNSDVYANRVESNFSESFAESNIQASGLFTPEDVGINLFDGQFHHIVVSWSVDELGEGAGDNSELGSGVVTGYIDGYKLFNKEQVSPRLSGSDGAKGPVLQSNMLDQRIPIRKHRLRSTDVADAPKNNNIYIGISNYNRSNGDSTGDIGNIASIEDQKIDGAFDGQIQNIRVWNHRLKDGTTSVNHNTGTLLIDPSPDQAAATASLGLSYRNFYHSSLTSTSASNIVGWWRFNNLGSTTAFDLAGGLSANEAAMTNDPFGNLSSLTGYSTGNAYMKLYDTRDILLSVSGNDFTDESASSINRTFLYYDQKDVVNPVDNDLNQGRVVRKNIENKINKTGTIFYDTGQIVIDNADPNTTVDFTWPTSGNEFGFSVTSDDQTAFNIERVKYVSNSDQGRLLLDAAALGEEYNYSSNKTSLNPETKETIFENPTTFITSVGLYNDEGDLLAVSKLSRPIRKDSSIRADIQIKLDF